MYVCVYVCVCVNVAYLQSRVDLEGRSEVGCDAIVENGELSIGRQEVQRAGGLELVQVHALVEVTVVQDNLTQEADKKKKYHDHVHTYKHTYTIHTFILRLIL